MPLTNEQAQHLIDIDKWILVNDSPANTITINQEFPMRLRFELVSKDEEYQFLWSVTQSKKDTLRMSFHCQEDESELGILRVDYNAGHQNPAEVLDTLPDKFIPYVGKLFGNKESHVHYHVDGYKTLAWAMPLTGVEQINVKEIAETNSDTIKGAIEEFARLINIKTTIIFNGLLL